MTTQVGAPALAERLQRFVGLQSNPPFTARDPVNQPMIRHWCDAMGDTNPLYTDPLAAAESIHGAVVAPPAMLQAWIMYGLHRVPPPFEQDVMGQLFAELDAAGFTSIVATNCEQEYVRYLHLGDLLTVDSVIEAVSEEKRTGLGAGHFVTTRLTYTDQSDAVVATMLFRVLKFRPPETAPPAGDAAPAPPPIPRRPRPAINGDNRFFWDGVARGELLIQRCTACDQLRHPPRPMCPLCHSLEWDTVRASGLGSLHSYVITHHPRVPWLPDANIVALVDLTEGTRLVSNLIGVDPAEVRIGMPLELVFERVDDELILPQFRPAAGAMHR
jgi:uncharacterized OB-fold protein/acyl dehydratase